VDIAATCKFHMQTKHQSEGNLDFTLAVEIPWLPAPEQFGVVLMWLLLTPFWLAQAVRRLQKSYCGPQA